MANLEPPPFTNARGSDSRSSSRSRDAMESIDVMSPPEKGLDKWRRVIGLIILAIVIILWTGTSFLASALLADHSFSKPYFLSYFNTAFFTLPMIPVLARRAYLNPEEFWEWLDKCRARLKRPRTWFTRRHEDYGRSNDSRRFGSSRRSAEISHERLLGESTDSLGSQDDFNTEEGSGQLSIAETAKLSVQFCFLWFLASYLLLACLEHTSVASSTILTSTSSVFTLFFGAISGVETFTIRKLTGVLASLAGIMIIAWVDHSGKSSDEEHRGDFPEKSPGELALGNMMALASAVVYGIYAVFMKKRIPDETRVSMPIFFGFVGLTNVVFLWPGFFILHYTGIETFEIPSGHRIVSILILNAVGSALSDILWAYAVVFTSPILVTVGLSLNIPLSLVGQKFLNSQTSTWLYWVGAAIVVLSFVVVN